MEMSERVRELRKKHLKMSQTAFGERLGVSRSVINNIESNALARPDQKLSLIKLMCKEFSVSEEWILNGTGPMFVQADTFSLDKLAKERGATELELSIAKAYFELPQAVRSDILTKLSAFVANVDQKVAEAPPPAPAPKIAAVPARPAEQIAPDPDRAAWEKEADEFAEIAREQFILQKKRESEALSAKSSNAG